MRSEQAIFDELAALCRSKGFIHAVAFLCFQNNFIHCNDELRAEDMAPMFSDTRLIRTEMTTLIGLMMRAPIDFTLPPPEVLSEHYDKSKKLLAELHQAIVAAAKKNISLANATESGHNPFIPGEVLREPMFYSGESAYSFQYRDLAPRKYRADAAWLLHNKHLDLDVSHEVCRSITALLDVRVAETLKSLQDTPMPKWTMLPGFTFSCDEIATRTNHPVESVRAVIEAFTEPVGERNGTFTSLHEFNAAYAYPFIRSGLDAFILLQHYGIWEALYETPFYWMRDDKAYETCALKHRGEFAESFAAERLTRVFGSDRVFKNVEMVKSKRRVLGEIDVFVCFGNCAIVLQAKSKKLTLEARKGNDPELQRDFKTAVQRAVDQAFACAEVLGDPSVTLRCRDGRTVPLTEHPKTIFPVSVVTDHYPALAFQALQFLKATPSERIVRPLVIDVFTLDSMTEMLASPLRLLSYLNLRAGIGDNMTANHERTLLSCHLMRNLWLEKDAARMLLHDNVSSDLDIAMAVRRDGVSGAATPAGILTWFKGTTFARIIDEIEDKADPAAIELGFTLLELNVDTVRTVNEGISQIMGRTSDEGGLQVETFVISSASAELTVYCSWLDNKAAIMLKRHCEDRRDSQMANNWFGLAIRPDGSVQACCKA